MEAEKSMELKRILLVEDSDYDVELAMEALAVTNLANEVVVCRDGQEALDYLNRQGSYRSRTEGNPAVVLLDLKLPKVDGLEVLRLVKGNPLLRMVPVVMLTSSREEIDLATSYAIGANAYVVKPIEFTEFVQALQELGLFWAVINQPPPGAYNRARS